MGKFNVNFSDGVYQLVGEMALDRGITMSDVIRDAVSICAWMDDELRTGHKILVDRGNGVVQEIVLPHAMTLHREGRPKLGAPQPVQKAAPAAAR